LSVASLDAVLDGDYERVHLDQVSPLCNLIGGIGDGVPFRVVIHHWFEQREYCFIVVAEQINCPLYLLLRSLAILC
jgi:hypothetical protein